jgi:hypothetical protein
MFVFLASTMWLAAPTIAQDALQDSKPKEVAHMPDTETSHAPAHAEAKIAVQSSDAQPFDETRNPPLTEIHINETFTGDLEGDSTVRALQIASGTRSASLISLQRFRGKLGGRQGTFVLQGQETVVNGKIKATWFVVPGSGTDGLSGLRGKGGFEGEFGKGSVGTLDYWFE